jgi:hypothetical protein
VVKPAVAETPKRASSYTMSAYGDPNRKAVYSLVKGNDSLTFTCAHRKSCPLQSLLRDILDNKDAGLNTVRERFRELGLGELDNRTISLA